MLDLLQGFQTDLNAQPLWIQIWVTWLFLINTASIFFFFTRAEARWVFAAWIVAAAGVMGLYAVFGFERILGLGHVIAWTPLLWYLWRRRGEIFLTHGSGVYLHLLFLSNGISLVFDYIDVVRFFLGHGY